MARRRKKNGDFLTYKEIDEKKADRLIGECLAMIRAIKKDPMLRRVYSDINFYGIIEDIQEQRRVNEEVKEMEWLCGI